MSLVGIVRVLSLGSIVRTFLVGATLVARRPVISGLRKRLREGSAVSRLCGSTRSLLRLHFPRRGSPLIGGLVLSSALRLPIRLQGGPSATAL